MKRSSMANKLHQADIDEIELMNYYDEISNMDKIESNQNNEKYDIQFNEKEEGSLLNDKNHDLVTNIGFKGNNPSNSKEEKNIINISEEKPTDIKHINANQNRIYVMDRLQDFVEYLNLQINKDKNAKLTKEALIVLYNQLQKYLHITPLKRDEKRNKKKIIKKLYKYSAEIIKCIEQNQQEIIIPVLLFLRSKMNQRKVNIRRVNYLKNILM